MENNPVQITITDLDEIRQIIDLASTRGAFRGGEMRRVGEIYDKLDIFIQAIVASASSRQTQGETDD
jgi:hypothetical protein